jgi:hypothetical protein
MRGPPVRSCCPTSGGIEAMNGLPTVVKHLLIEVKRPGSLAWRRSAMEAALA